MGKGRRVLKGDAALGARAASFFYSLLQIPNGRMTCRSDRHVLRLECELERTKKRPVQPAAQEEDLAMFTTYAALNTNITKAIRNHLMDVDALPPTMALAELANEITDVVFSEMNNVGLTKETIDSVVSVDRVQAKTARSAV